jgi:dTDP-4-amino-4,6-dideoxygalactose transaminase
MKKNGYIPFSVPPFIGKELKYINEAIKSGKLSGDGPFTKLSEELIEKQTQSKKILLTPSCTAALELSALLIDIKKGDEVIMPSFTFTSTANAFILQGARPIFVDIDYETLNISIKEIKKAITKKTKAIVPVHYAGVACEMDAITELKESKKLFIIEDAAQAYYSFYKEKHLGTIGDIGAFSFHDTKNITSGEGGAISINNTELIERAEIIREKGTNRKKFLLGEVDKYTWCDIGTSCLPSEITSSYLLAQLEAAEKITQKRLGLWSRYNNLLKKAEDDNLILRPKINKLTKHNAHIFYVIFPDKKIRDLCIDFMKKNGIVAPFHYIPLHSSPAAEKYSDFCGSMKNTNLIAERIMRLPLWYGLSETNQNYIIKKFLDFIYKRTGI